MQHIYTSNTTENKMALRNWASTKLEFGTISDWETATKLRQSWEEFSGDMDIIQARYRDLASTLREHGAMPRRSGSRGRFWVGVRVKP